MDNLLEETVKILKENGKSFEDIKFVVKEDIGKHITNINSVKELFKNVNYDSGFGGAEISEHLKVVGDNWWLERHDYDGSEWWEYKTIPLIENSKLTQEKILN